MYWEIEQRLYEELGLGHFIDYFHSDGRSLWHDNIAGGSEFSMLWDWMMAHDEESSCINQHRSMLIESTDEGSSPLGLVAITPSETDPLLGVLTAEFSDSSIIGGFAAQMVQRMLEEVSASSCLNKIVAQVPRLHLPRRLFSEAFNSQGLPIKSIQLDAKFKGKPGIEYEVDIRNGFSNTLGSRGTNINEFIASREVVSDIREEIQHRSYEGVNDFDYSVLMETIDNLQGQHHARGAQWSS
jgi:hypothetical protein